METTTMDRWYVRCVDCLSIGAVEMNPNGQTWACGVCNGKIEVMGKVEKDHLETERITAACDARCTHARGPKCICKCNCANHGSGRVVRVIVTTAIPTIEFTDIEHALENAIAYRAAVAALQTVMALPEYTRNYWSLYAAKQLLRKAQDARRQDTRMKRLVAATAALPNLVPAPSILNQATA